MTTSPTTSLSHQVRVRDLLAKLPVLLGLMLISMTLWLSIGLAVKALVS